MIARISVVILVNLHRIQGNTHVTHSNLKRVIDYRSKNSYINEKKERKMMKNDEE